MPIHRRLIHFAVHYWPWLRSPEGRILCRLARRTNRLGDPRAAALRTFGGRRG